MKKLVLLIVAIATMSVAQAQQGQVEAKINPLGFLFGSPELSGEYIVSDYFGVELALSTEFGKASFVSSNDYNPTKSGFGARVVGKYYFSPDDGADGWYGGVYLRTKSLTIEDKDNDGYNGFKRSVTSGGLEFGKKWVFDTGVLVELGLGLGRAFSEKNEWIDSDNNSEDYGVDFGIDGYSKLVVGYRF